MSHLSADASQAFLRRVILPLAGLVVGLMISAVAGIVWIATYQTDVAIAQQARLATGALRIHADKLGVSASDYGYWDEAVRAIVDEPDAAWVSDNIGAGAEKSLGTAMSFALDPTGKSVYSRVGGVEGTEDPARFFPQGFRAAHEAWKKLPPEKTYSGIVPYGNSAAIIAIAPVRAWDDAAKRPPTGYSLLFVQLLDGPLLESLSRDYELGNLRLTHSDSDISDPRATFSIRDGSGNIVSRLTWDPNRPGDGLLGIALPFLAFFLTALTALGAFIIRHAITSAQIISDREKRAFRDPLTGLSNRVLFFAEVDKAIRNIRPGDGAISVMYIDLDGFKAVNDSMGHGAGDILLQHVANRLKACVDDGDHVARLGGDEFAVLFAAPRDATNVERTARHILREVAIPYQLPAGPTHISCSIGIAEGKDAGESATDLVDRADSALYRAKASGRNCLVVDGERPRTAPGRHVA
jgi:diguanylate cyclase (GGDEF)-like protein